MIGLDSRLTNAGYLPLDPRSPAWIRDVARFLPIRSQFVLTGNVADYVLMPMEDTETWLRLKSAVAALLEATGYDFLLCYDKFDFIQLLSPTPARVTAAKTATGLSLDGEGRAEATLEKLIDVMKRLVRAPKVRGGLLIDYAARLGKEEARDFFGAFLKLSHTAPQLPMSDGKVRMSPVFWVAESTRDLPDWLVLRNERIREQVIPKPDLDVRVSAAQAMITMLDNSEVVDPSEREEIIRGFARATDGFTLDGMLSVIQIARDQELGFSGLLDAVRFYKLGITDNRWQKPELRRLIRNAEPMLEAQVKGQHQAVVKSVDILRRSVSGLSGAQANSSASLGSGRPRGVLFFAGPTGVGKTELAKAITRLLFDDERAYIRFDMSEFAQDHTEARLVGAPPGYIGHDGGGELTSAIRERPFSVVLFDEIEKAHPKILDKFLQILEDGRLTDGQGGTVYFSEAIIIFTSNLGIYVDGPGGTRVAHVDPSMSYPDVESRVRSAIEDYFKFKLSRPEILNRLGDNIVVFNFISRDVAAEIFERQFSNVIARVKESRGIDLQVEPDARAQMFEFCSNDLANGGRGIGNRLETVFINPLSRALFDERLDDRTQITVTDVRSEAGVFSLVVS